jgi:hypothetical protein
LDFALSYSCWSPTQFDFLPSGAMFALVESKWR